MILCLARRPTGQQILVVDEKAAVFEDRSGGLLVERPAQLNPRAARGLVIGPIIKWIDAQVFFRELVNGVDRSSQICTRQEHDPSGVRFLLALSGRN